jgi:hypothetical protein
MIDSRFRLKPIKSTAVHTPDLVGYLELMRVYEYGTWRWRDDKLPSKVNIWDEYKEETCISACPKMTIQCFRQRILYSPKKLYLDEGWKVISTQEFYKEQKITPKLLFEINNCFKRC